MLTSNGSPLCTENKAIDKKKYFVVYTVLFAVAAFLVYNVLFKYDLTFVRTVDGTTQHFPAFEYYGKWLRSIIRTLLTEGRLELKNFDFAIGMGSDVITTLNYYAIGDPLNLLSALAPVRYAGIMYTLVALLRNYLAGFAFSLYCFERKHTNFYGVLISSLLYTFCAFSIVAGTNHPFFINPMIYMPLIFISVEKILKNRNPIYLALIVCVAEMSNFYFFYILVFTTIVYVFLRLFAVYKTQIKKMIAPLIKIAVSAVIGVILGAVIFYPVVINFLSDGRLSAEHNYPLLYDANYYLSVFGAMLYHKGIAPWTLVGSTVLFVFGLTALFIRRKRNLTLKLSVLICIIGLSLPAFGGFSNGFSYACNRWCFVFSFVLSYICSETWDDMFGTDKKKGVIIALSPVAYALLCLLSPYTIDDRLYKSLVFILLISVSVLLVRIFPANKNTKKLIQTAVIIINVVCLATNGYYALSGETGRHSTQRQLSTNDAGEFVALSEYRKMMNVENTVDNEDFYRVTSDKLAFNEAVRRPFYGTQYYWSLSNSYVSEFQDSICLDEGFYQCYNGFDDMAVFNSLAAVRYYYDNPEAPGAIPYGFTETEAEGFYENPNALPLAYTYDKYVTEEEYNATSNSLEKQQVMMNSVVLEKDTQAIEKGSIETSASKIEFEVTPESEYVTFADNTFTVTKKGEKATFYFKNATPGETYISIRNIVYEPTETMELFTDNTDVDPNNLFDEETFKQYKAADIVKNFGAIKNWARPQILNIFFNCAENGEVINGKHFQYFTPDYRFYVGKSDFDICLGYSENGYTSVTVSFPMIGRYSFEDLSFFAQDMTFYDEGIENLSKDVLENTLIGNDKITGTVDLQESKILCFTIPYSEGWTAYVDGVEQPVLKANIMNVAIEVPEGSHQIELRYRTPNLRLGLVMSLFGLVLIFGYGLWYYIGKKKNRFDFVEID